MSKAIKWWLIHLLHWAVLYGAFAMNLDGAMYVLKFFVWLMAPLSMALMLDQAAKDSAKKPPQPIREACSWTQAWVTLFLLVWFGHIASALAWAFVLLMFGAHRSEVRKIRAAQATA